MRRLYFLFFGIFVFWQISHAKGPGMLNDTTYLQFLLCPGVTTTTYAGATLSLGDVRVFHLLSQTGLDSVVKVTVNQAPVVDFWATAEPICEGATNGVIEFYDHVGITAPYLFSIDGGATFSDLYTREGLTAGHYELRAKDRLGCVYEYDIEIPVAPPIRIEMRSKIVSCTDSVALTFSFIGHQKLPHEWTWQSPDLPAPSTDSIFWAKKPGTYHLRVTHACDTVERAIEVVFKEEPAAAQFFLPNAFSPNGDGINDCFMAHASPDLQLLEYQLLVFDRWGNQVFEGKGIEECWDGSIRGKAADSTAFAWLLSARLLDCAGEERRVLREGGVMVVR